MTDNAPTALAARDADSTRVRFPCLSSRAFEHPADAAALAAMRKIPGFDLALRKLIGLVGERSLRLATMAGAIRVNAKQFPRVHRVYEDCLSILDLAEKPELFVTQTPFINAGAIGVDRPIIVLNSAILSLLDEEELRFVLGHEIGHILADHVLYKTMFALVLRLGVAVSGISIGMLAIAAIAAGLAEWDRKSELSCDRAGLLCLQDVDSAYRVIAKMAGGVPKMDLSIPDYMVQAEEYEAGGDQIDSVFKLLNLLGIRHPWHSQRLLELRRWVASGAYGKVMGGEYARRDGDKHSSVYDDFKSSVRSYHDSFRDSKDPLIKTVREVADEIGAGGAHLWDSLKRRFTGDGGGGGKDDSGQGGD